MRQEIYRHLLVQSSPFVVNYLYYKKPWSRPPGLSKEYFSWLRDWERAKLCISILRVSRQVSDEALDVLYGDNTFEVRLDEGDPNFVGRFAHANQLRIRRLQLQLQPMGLWYQPDHIEIDAGVWTPILAGANRIRIIALRPVLYTGYFDERKIDEWLEWLHPVLLFINQHVLSTKRIVLVEDDNRTDTAKLMEACFPGGYRRMAISPLETVAV